MQAEEEEGAFARKEAVVWSITFHSLASIQCPGMLYQLIGNRDLDYGGGNVWK
jgi:hypothetical protein